MDLEIFKDSYKIDDNFGVYKADLGTVLIDDEDVYENEYYSDIVGVEMIGTKRVPPKNDITLGSRIL